MFKHYLISALRFLRKNKIFALINIAGLSIALAVSFIIFLFVINELSFNSSHKNRKQVYRVLNEFVDFSKTHGETPFCMAKTLKDELPQVEKASNTFRIKGLKLKYKEENIDVQNALTTDSEFFDIFSFKMINRISGRALLDDKNSIVLSHRLAAKVFPGQNPVGKEITVLINKKENLLTVTGVFEDLPENSSIQAKCFINSQWSIDKLNLMMGIDNIDVSWNENWYTTWIMLSKDCDISSVENQFRDIEKSKLGGAVKHHYSLQNLSDIYLNSENIDNNGFPLGNKGNIRLFSVIAFLIIIVAVVNYVILSTAVSTGRAKEIGIRKAAGAGTKELKTQLLTESVVLSLLALPIALILMQFVMPVAERLFQTRLYVINSNILIYLSVYLLLTILCGVISGIYTSSYLSNLKVMDILARSATSGKSKNYLRSSLIAIQLIIFCSFVSCALVIRSQYRFAVNNDPGFNNKDILLIDLDNSSNYQALIDGIRSNPDVVMAAGAIWGIPCMDYSITLYQHFRDMERKVPVEHFEVDYDFLKTMGVKVVEGRDFSRDFGNDMENSVILNQKAIKELGLDDAVGKKLFNKTIIGVVDDFKIHSIHSDTPPLCICMSDKYIHQIAVHYRPGTLNTVLPELDSQWQKIVPGKPFSYTLIEDVFKEIYSSEKDLTGIVSVASLFILLIAAFGLFGLTLFIVSTRTKTIGIKKVFGSTERSIVCSFLKENFRLVLFAAIISVPATFYFMDKWLNNYSFRTGIRWWVFVVTFILASAVVLVTTFIHAYRASLINPAQALKYE